MRQLLPATLRGPLRQGMMWSRHRLGLYQSEARLAADAQLYWTQTSGAPTPGNYHERGAGPFADDDAAWQGIGREHLAIFEGFARQVEFTRALRRVIEWGCGGGSNALSFAPKTDEFVGIDVSPQILEECTAQLQRAGLDNFSPVLVDVTDIEPVVQRFAGSCDLFLCTYVYELLPSKTHGLRLLAAAGEMLRPGGMALIQIKYDTGELRTRARRWDYARHVANNTTYRIDEFWVEAARLGLIPRGVFLMPVAAVVADERYAYFALLKPEAEGV